MKEKEIKTNYPMISFLDNRVNCNTTVNKKHQAGIIRFCLFFFYAVLSLSIWAQKIPAKPNPPRLVNDFAGVLTPYQISHLEERLVAYDDTTSVQIAIVIVKSLDGANVDDYAIELARKWGVGNKKTNNGVVILVSTGGGEGQRKVFISPGYGLEEYLSDFTCKTIVDAEMIPFFKQGNIYKGLENGAGAVIDATKGRYKAPPGYRNRGSEGGGGGLLFLLLMIFILVLVFGNRGGGDDGSEAMTRRGHRHMNRPPPFIFFPPIGGGGGGGGFGGGGGGFGGFGGGGFGGGGAGGSW